MGKINTLKHDSDDQGGSDSDDDGRQGFFVGGSEHSGQEVLGPNDAERRAQQLFEAMRRAGAEELTGEEVENMHRKDSGPKSGYHGGAYRLGTASDPVVLPPQQPQQQQPEADRGRLIVHLIVWQNGFSVDDGPLRSLTDPANRSFMMALQMGMIPPELQQQHPGRQIDLHLERRATDYVPPKIKPFGSSGHRLGGIVPEVVTLDDDDDANIAKVPMSAKEIEELKAKAQAELKVDDDKPKGQICIRQPDGQRLIGEFNESHTVEHVRSFITSALPQFAFQPFQLHTTYPKQPIDDEKKTVVEAGIFKGTVAIVRT